MVWVISVSRTLERVAFCEFDAGVSEGDAESDAETGLAVVDWGCEGIELPL